MITFIEGSIKRCLPVGFIWLMFGISAYAEPIQTNAANKSQLTIIAADSKTNIVVTGFPAKTTVVVFDDQNNLLSIVSTNNDGAVSLTLPSNIKNTIYVKTLNGEIVVSGKTINESEKGPEIFAMKKRTVLNRV
jgi:hypothetical protein